MVCLQIQRAIRGTISLSSKKRLVTPLITSLLNNFDCLSNESTNSQNRKISTLLHSSNRVDDDRCVHNTTLANFRSNNKISPFYIQQRTLKVNNLVTVSAAGCLIYAIVSHPIGILTTCGCLVVTVFGYRLLKKFSKKKGRVEKVLNAFQKKKNAVFGDIKNRLLYRVARRSVSDIREMDQIIIKLFIQFFRRDATLKPMLEDIQFRFVHFEIIEDCLNERIFISKIYFESSLNTGTIEVKYLRSPLLFIKAEINLANGAVINAIPNLRKIQEESQQNFFLEKLKLKSIVADFEDKLKI